MPTAPALGRHSYVSSPTPFSVITGWCPAGTATACGTSGLDTVLAAHATSVETSRAAAKGLKAIDMAVVLLF
jgi:hypothetical protein